MTWQLLFWAAAAVTVVFLAGSAVALKRWLAISHGKLRQLEQRLAAARKKLDEETVEQQAVVKKFAVELNREKQDCQEWQQSLESQSAGLDHIQSTLALILDDAEPCCELLGDDPLASFVCGQNGKAQSVPRQDVIPIAIDSSSGFIELRLRNRTISSDRPLYVLLRHRSSDYLRISAHSASSVQAKLRVARLEFQSLIEHQHFGTWDVFLLVHGRVADRLSIDVRPDESLFLSQLKVTASRVGVLPRQGTTVRRLESSGEDVIAAQTRSLFPFIRMHAPWSHPYRVRVVIEADEGTSLAVRERHSDPQSHVLEWITEIPVEDVTPPGKYHLRWQVALGDKDVRWHDMADLKFRFVRPAIAVDWLDAEGELKQEYVDKISKSGITAQEILAGLTT